MKIFGEKFSKDEILKRAGDISQICDVKSFECNDGLSMGISELLPIYRKHRVDP